MEEKRTSNKRKEDTSELWQQMKERVIQELETNLRTVRLGRVSQFLPEGMAKPSQSSNRDVRLH
ncbi:hypothetical protein YC2023_074469 [Brassica napus]